MSDQQACSIESTGESGISILAVNGPDLNFFTSPSFRNQIERLLEDGERKFIIDLNKVTYIDSSAFPVLVDAQRRCREDGFVLLVHKDRDENAEDNSVLRAIIAAGLDRVFMIFPTVKEAVNYANEYQTV